jgi:excisionase family DNA binding protein
MGKENHMENDLQLLSMTEARTRLGISSWAIYQQINKRALKTVKIGGRRLVSVRALNEFIESKEGFGSGSRPTPTF